MGRSPAARRHRGGGWPARVEEADFIVLTCALTAANRHMLNESALARARRGVRVVNVARGPLSTKLRWSGTWKRPGVSSGGGCVRRGAAGCRLAAPRAESLYSRLAQRLEYRGRRAAGQQPGHRPALRIFGSVVSADRTAKTALITGAVGGAGSALCATFTDAGYRVIGCDVRDGRPSCDTFLQCQLLDLCGSEAERQELLARSVRPSATEGCRSW